MGRMKPQWLLCGGQTRFVQAACGGTSLHGGHLLPLASEPTWEVKELSPSLLCRTKYNAGVGLLARLSRALLPSLNE